MAKITRDMVKETLKETIRFPSEHFGLRVGADWPEFVTEALKSQTVREIIARDFVVANLKAQSVQEDVTTESIFSVLTIDPEFVESFLRWMYIGVRLGRRLAETEQLERLAAIGSEG